MMAFMQCVAEAVACHGVRGLCELAPGGGYLHDVAADALRRHREKRRGRRLEEELKLLVAAKGDEALAAAEQAVRSVASGLSAREQLLLAQYLAGIPEAARRTLRRADDPTGTSLPAGLSLATADQVAGVLPQSPPRFVAGDPVPGLSSWRLIERLGGGGGGEVWRASHEYNLETRAVKLFTDPTANYAAAVSATEATAARRSGSGSGTGGQDQRPQLRQPLSAASGPGSGHPHRLPAAGAVGHRAPGRPGRLAGAAGDRGDESGGRGEADVAAAVRALGGEGHGGHR